MLQLVARSRCARFPSGCFDNWACSSDGLALFEEDEDNVGTLKLVLELEVLGLVGRGTGR
jgi:hypothetical protein